MSSCLASSRPWPGKNWSVVAGLSAAVLTQMRDEGLKRFLAQAAVGAVADVEADQLVAAAAGAEVLRTARQGGGRGGEGQDGCHRLHLLAGLAVEVDPARLGGGQGLAARGRGAHPVELLRVHGGED